MVILIPDYNIQNHAPKHLLNLGIRQPQRSHYIKRLLIGICPEEPVVIMRYSAESLHMQFASVLAVKSLGQKMSPAILLNQRACRHVYSTFPYKFIERVFQSAKVLSFTKSGLSNHTVEFDKIVIKTLGCFNLA